LNFLGRLILSDVLQRFVFEATPIRGEIVHLDHTWKTVLERHHYPEILRDKLGELMAAAALLAATLKLRGSLILQIQGSGPVSLLVVECTGELSMRATAKWEGELPSGGLAELIGDGRFAITLDPQDGSQAYQGIVALEGDSVAEILENYMRRSEQLDTRLVLSANGGQAGGMLLQKLPGKPEQDEDAWNRAGQFLDTVTAQELLELSPETLLHRLFHEEDLRLFDPQPVTFHCRCSRSGVANMLKMLGKEEVQSILEEHGNIEVNCEFCNQQYTFDVVDAEQIFSGNYDLPGSQTRH
jgi:molecular chaperone Hsp33